MIKRTFHIRGQTQAAYFISSKLVGYVIMTTYALLGNIILAEKTFKMVAWLELVRVDVFLFIPLAVQMGTELYSSIQRIQVLFYGFIRHFKSHDSLVFPFFSN